MAGSGARIRPPRIRNHARTRWVLVAEDAGWCRNGIWTRNILMGFFDFKAPRRKDWQPFFRQMSATDLLLHGHGMPSRLEYEGLHYAYCRARHNPALPRLELRQYEIRGSDYCLVVSRDIELSERQLVNCDRHQVVGKGLAETLVKLDLEETPRYVMRRKGYTIGLIRDRFPDMLTRDQYVFFNDPDDEVLLRVVLGKHAGKVIDLHEVNSRCESLSKP